MESHRLTRKIFDWDRKLNMQNLVDTWGNEIQSIFYECDLKLLFDSGLNFDSKFTLKYIKDKFMLKQTAELHEQCLLLPKLRTFVKFKTFGQEAAFIRKPINYYHRRLMSKIRLGCLPLNLETGRYLIPRLPEEKRICVLCKKDSESPEIESESNFLFMCRAYVNYRQVWYQAMTLPDNFDTMSLDDRFKSFLMSQSILNQQPILSLTLSLKDKNF